MFLGEVPTGERVREHLTIVIIGVDPSTKVGVAVVDDGTILHTEVYAAPRLKGLIRAGNLAGQLMELVTRHQPSYLVFEGYSYSNHDTLVTLVEIGTVLRYFVEQAGIAYYVVAPTSLKKFVTGKGNSKKELILLEVYKRWGHSAETDDEADAVGLAMFGMAMHGKINMPKINMEPVIKVMKTGN